MAATKVEVQNNMVAGYTHFRKVGKSMALTVPKAVRGALDWVEGQALFVYVVDNHIVISSLVEHMQQSMSEYDNKIIPD